MYVCCIPARCDNMLVSCSPIPSDTIAQPRANTFLNDEVHDS